MATRYQRDFHLGLADLADELGRPPGLREAARLMEMNLSAAVRFAKRLRERGIVADGSLALLRPPPPAPYDIEVTGEGRRALLAFRGLPEGAG